MSRAEIDFIHCSSKNNSNNTDQKQNNNKTDRKSTIVYSEAKKILDKYLGPVETARVFNQKFFEKEIVFTMLQK